VPVHQDLPLQDIFYDAPQHNLHQEPVARLSPQNHLLPFLQNDAFDFGCLDYEADAVPGPSMVILPTGIPETRLIPPTPTAVQDLRMDSVSSGLHLDNIQMDRSADIVPGAKGRRQDATNALLREGFVDLECIINELSNKTSLPAHQVVSLWNKSHGWVINNINHWNAYSSYFRENLKQELSRLGGEAPKPHGTPS
jgi:hypothetical protein